MINKIVKAAFLLLFIATIYQALEFFNSGNYLAAIYFQLGFISVVILNIYFEVMKK